MRREQDRAVRAVAMLLFERPARPSAAEPAAPAEAKPAAEPEARASLELLLRSSLDVLEPLLRQHQVAINLAVAPALPMARANPMVVRQLLITILTWLIREMPDSTCEVQVSAYEHWLTVTFAGGLPDENPSADEIFNRKEELQTISQLAVMAHAEVSSQASADAGWSLRVRLPASPKKTVLMVDDNMDAIRLAQRYLEQNEEFNLVTLSVPGETLQQTRSPATCVHPPRRDDAGSRWVGTVDATKVRPGNVPRSPSSSHPS